MDPKPSRMYAGIAFILAPFILVIVEVSFAQYGMSRYEACGVLCGDQGNDYIGFRSDNGFWGGFLKPLIKPPGNWEFLKTGTPRPPPTAGGCNDWGQSCWGGYKRKRRY